MNSIIIPEQTQNAELILVNDGSKDNSLKVMRHLQNSSSNVVKIVNLPNNTGLLNARAQGVLAASGKYIIPLDADDVLTEDILENLYHVLNEEPDLIHLRMLLETKNGNLEAFSWGSPQVKRMRGAESFQALLKGQLGHNQCGKVISRQLYLKSLNLIGLDWTAHHHIIYGEDLLLTVAQLSLYPFYRGVKQDGYIYKQTESGAMRQKDTVSLQKQYEDLKTVAEKLLSITNQNFHKEIREYCNRVITNAVGEKFSLKSSRLEL